MYVCIYACMHACVRNEGQKGFQYLVPTKFRYSVCECVMYVWCMYVTVCVCIYSICTYTNTCIQVHGMRMYGCMYSACMCVCMVFICVHMYIYIYIYIHSMHAYKHRHVFIHSHVIPVSSPPISIFAHVMKTWREKFLCSFSERQFESLNFFWIVNNLLCMCVCVYVCVYVCMHACMYVYMYV
jgi:hypothetical protein